jgi:hypothetical protein
MYVILSKHTSSTLNACMARATGNKSNEIMEFSILSSRCLKICLSIIYFLYNGQYYTMSMENVL